MKMTQKRTIFCVVMLMCALFGSAQVIELSDGWECQSSAGGKSYVTKVPTTVMGALVSNGEFPDLFVRDNYKKYHNSRFLVPWLFKKNFLLDSLAADEHVTLLFEGLG